MRMSLRHGHGCVVHAKTRAQRAKEGPGPALRLCAPPHDTLRHRRHAAPNRSQALARAGWGGGESAQGRERRARAPPERRHHRSLRSLLALAQSSPYRCESAHNTVSGPSLLPRPRTRLGPARASPTAPCALSLVPQALVGEGRVVPSAGDAVGTAGRDAAGPANTRGAPERNRFVPARDRGSQLSVAVAAVGIASRSLSALSNALRCEATSHEACVVNLFSCGKTRKHCFPGFHR